MPNNIVDISNMQFGEWTVLYYIGKGRWWCRCSCGKEKDILGKSLRSGTTKSCGHNINQNKVKDITGKKFGDLTAIEYIPNSHGYWKCKCSCGNIINVHNRYLNNHTKKSCGHENIPKIKIGDKFGDWSIIGNPIDYKWLCRCSCGAEKRVLQYRLLDGTSTSCGHKSNRLIDLTGRKFGEWTALEYIGDQVWKCQCSCGNIENVHSKYLRYGESVRCSKCRKHKDLIDLTGRQFGELTVLEYIGEKKWKCKCSCGKYSIVLGVNLRNGTSTSCGHKLIEHMQRRSYIQRSDIQLKAAIDRQSLLNMIGDDKISFKELSDKLGLSYGATLRVCKKLDVLDKISYMTNVSYKEQEVYNYVRSILPENIEVIQSDRKLLDGKEIDIYIPSKNIAIEFNGNYWHSNLYKDKYYHQNKTIECAKKHVRLIHIFEYEWDNIEQQEKLKNLLKSTLLENKIYYGRNTNIIEIDNKTTKQFLDKYHLQGYTNSEINIGLQENNEILGVMTIGIPRFNNQYEYEIIRVAFKSDTTVIGGLDKMFKYFKDIYKPKSIITYSDISKFTGNSYTKLGFKPTEYKYITEPNYIWYNPYTQDIMSRYKTQKKKLLYLGLGTEDETEDIIMEDLDYIKIYDSGNIKLEYVA